MIHGNINWNDWNLSPKVANHIKRKADREALSNKYRQSVEIYQTATLYESKFLIMTAPAFIEAINKKYLDAKDGKSGFWAYSREAFEDAAILRTADLFDTSTQRSFKNIVDMLGQARSSGLIASNDFVTQDKVRDVLQRVKKYRDRVIAHPETVKYLRMDKARRMLNTDALIALGFAHDCLEGISDKLFDIHFSLQTSIELARSYLDSYLKETGIGQDSEYSALRHQIDSSIQKWQELEIQS